MNHEDFNALMAERKEMIPRWLGEMIGNTHK
jgi:hypothetical protein